MTFYFLTIQVVILLKLEQALKDFLDLKICRALNKLLFAKEEEAATAEAEDNGTVLMTAVTQEQEQVSKLLRKERDY